MGGNPTGGASGKSGPVSPANLAWGGVGLVAGGLSTLVGDLGVKQLLEQNPYIGLAVFCLLAAFIVFIAGLVARLTGRAFSRIMMGAGLLVVVGVLFGGFSAYVAPQRLEIVVSPQLEGVPAIEIMGSPKRNLDWETPVDYRLDGRRTLILSASRFQGHYRSEIEKAQARCLAVIDASNIGSTEKAY